MIIDHLIVDQFGSFIGKYQGRLKVTCDGKTKVEAPVMHLRGIYIHGRGVSISSDALEACCREGIPVFYLDSLGRSIASVYSAGLGATIKTRREQLYALQDERGIHIALHIIAGKIHNQAVTLRYIAKNRKDSDPDLYQQLRMYATEVEECFEDLGHFNQLYVDDVRPNIMGIEGKASARYWKAVRLVIPQHYHWLKRETRGATDPINVLLNYGYGILYTQIEQAIILAGLDPYGGFLHVDRPGKPSLVLDMIEEFRQIAVDRVVFGLVNRNFQIQFDDEGKLADKTRRTFADKILTHLDTSVRYDGKRYALRHVIQMQARQLAGYLRSEHPEYRAFRGSY